MMPVFKAKVTVTYSQEYVDQLSAKVAQLEADKKVLHDTLTAERREREELRRALRPFVQTKDDPLSIDEQKIIIMVTVGDIRAARAAVNQEGLG